MKKDRRLIFAAIITLIIIVLFVLSSYFTKRYMLELQTFIQTYYLLGIIVYLILGIIDAIGIPISNVPLIPIIATGYGPLRAIVLTSVGWFIGSMIAFRIARKYGVDFIKKFIPLERLHLFQKNISKKHFFISIILIRIVMPNDFVNYGYGIFTKIKKRNFITPTIIGIILSVFVYLIINTLPVIYQIIVILIAVMIFYLVFYYYSKWLKIKKP